MFIISRYQFLLYQLQCYYDAFVASHSCTFRSLLSKATFIIVLIFICNISSATVYNVSTKTDLQNRMNAALPGDTVIVANGTYNWGQISFTNNNSISSSAWIVLKAQTLSGVVFTGTTYLHFKGTRVMVDGFKFANGNAGSNAVISFRSSSSNLSHYSRVTNITFDNYNSDTETDNEWIGLYGTNNRVDHCTFINKSNVRATIVVWYSSTTYPNPATSTYHRIDSNYFKGRSYMGSNGGETLRIGDSNSSRTDEHNVIEFNLFEDCTQTEPEIISNKSDYNVYRYNTFKNSKGGLTLRHGRYCSVYGNYFIVDNASVTQAYGIRVIDKGHKIFNNYFEGINGNSGSLTSFRSAVCLYNGLSSTNDTTDASKAAGYFPADSTIVAFNTIVDVKGGAGIVLGYIDGGANTFQPLGLQVSNNLIKMSQGQAAYLHSSNTSLTYSAEGNIYQAPSGLGLTSSSGFTSNTLTFGARVHGIQTAPSLVQDAAGNSANYSSLLNAVDVHGRNRSPVYDVGAAELNGTGGYLYNPLDSNVVGAGKPTAEVLPVQLISFNAVVVNKQVKLTWTVSHQINFKSFEVEWSSNGISFEKIGMLPATASLFYSFTHSFVKSKNYYRLKMVYKDGSYSYSEIRMINLNAKQEITVYPNPTKGIVNVNFNAAIKPGASINLTDGFGRILRTYSNITSNDYSISLKDLPAGIMYVHIIESGKTISIHPIILTP